MLQTPNLQQTFTRFYGQQRENLLNPADTSSQQFVQHNQDQQQQLQQQQQQQQQQQLLQQQVQQQRQQQLHNQLGLQQVYDKFKFKISHKKYRVPQI